MEIKNGLRLEYRNPFIYLVHPAGFEPATPGFEVLVVMLSLLFPYVPLFTVTVSISLT